MANMSLKSHFVSFTTLLQRIGLPPRTIVMLVKGALPPIIAMSMYQRNAVANVYGNFGVLIIVTSILAMPLQPRARFVQSMAMSVVLTCLAAAVVLLSHFCGLKARQHTQTPGGEAGYNASASTINAIFLWFVIWIVSSLRAAYPKYTIPFLLAIILSMVGITFGPTLLEQEKSLVLVKQLLLSFLTGYALSTAVSLFWFPLTSRSIFLSGTEDFLGVCEKLMKEERCLFGALVCKKADEETRKKQAIKIKWLAMTMLSSMARLREELGYARLEIAAGFYDSNDLSALLRCCEALMIPILGLSKIEGFIGRRGDTDSSCVQKRLVKENFRAFEQALQNLAVGKQRMALLTKTNRLKRRDLVSSVRTDKIDEKLDVEMGVATKEPNCLTEDARFEKKASTKPVGRDPMAQKVAQKQLYIQCLLSSTSQASSDLTAFSEETLVHGRNRGLRLILPPLSWLLSHIQSSITPNAEHLSPATPSQHPGNLIRHSLSFLSSDASKFGLRVTFATFSIGILAFLHQTQRFFVRYRLVWAMVMTPISMSPTSGTAIYGFIGRALGVAGAMLLTYVNWYIVDGRPAGVILVFGVCMMGYYWLLNKWPRFVVLFVLAAVNHVLIIGYELQVAVVTIAKATIAGQRYFPLYELAPYRILCVLAGLFVALIWTIFPTQVLEHEILRKKVGRSLTLLAQYSASVSATFDQRIRAAEGDNSVNSSPGSILKARRYAILFEELALLTEMRQISAMIPWELAPAGKFPKTSYDTLIDEIQSCVANLSVMAYISQAFPGHKGLPTHLFVLEQYANSHFIPTSNKATTVLSLLASAIVSGTPLMQGLEAPSHNEKLNQLLADAVELFGEAAMKDPNVEAFVVVEVAGEELLGSLRSMIEIVRDLVGEMDSANIV